MARPDIVGRTGDGKPSRLATNEDSRMKVAVLLALFAPYLVSGCASDGGRAGR